MVDQKRLGFLQASLMHSTLDAARHLFINLFVDEQLSMQRDKRGGRIQRSMLHILYFAGYFTPVSSIEGRFQLYIWPLSVLLVPSL